jgi:hypothetical protein
MSFPKSCKIQNLFEVSSKDIPVTIKKKKKKKNSTHHKRKPQLSTEICIQAKCHHSPQI